MIIALRTAVETMEKNVPILAKFVEKSGECLARKSCIRYIGSNTFGIWGIIDASECVPTYNSAYDDIRGFMSNNYFKANLNVEDEESSYVSDATPTNLLKCLSEISESSFIIFIDDAYDETIAQALSAKNHIGWIQLLSSKSPKDNLEFQLKLLDYSGLNWLSDIKNEKYNRFILNYFAEILLKLTLNTISTGAHILNGKVFQNIMIDVRVSNIKLFYRASEIIKTLAKVNDEKAQICLINSIHQIADNNNNSMLEKTVVDHITVAAENDNHIVPIALLMALQNKTYSQAKQEINICPKIRNIFC